MSNRRFREWSRKPADTTEAELAHKNLVAVNADLQRRLTTLERSTSLRVGRAILRVLQPLFVLLRVKRFSNKPPECTIESVWPRLSGTITIHQPSAELIPVRVWNSAETLMDQSIDPQSLLETSAIGPWAGRFEFSYPLGFSAFDPANLRARVGPVESGGPRPGDLPGGTGKTCRPIDVAIDSIIESTGDAESLRSNLRKSGAVAVLSTFRNQERTRAVPHRLVSELRSAGFLVVVVDTSDRLPPAEFDADLIIHRRNIGWDFASWMSTLAAFPWLIEEAETLLLINDSSVGPLAPLRPIFEHGRTSEADIWGLTDSWDIAYHLQSYFLCFTSSALRSGHVSDFVETFTFPSVKERIIGSGEIGLSQYMLERGLRLEALHPYTRLAQTFLDSFEERARRVLDLPEGRIQMENSLLSENDELNFLLDTVERIRTSAPINPTHYFWDILLSEGFPFVKRDLLTKNPDRISGLHRLSEFVRHDPARSVIDEELSNWSRTHPDFSLPLALNWRASEA